jgi:hypothetical protein
MECKEKTYASAIELMPVWHICQIYIINYKGNAADIIVFQQRIKSYKRNQRGIRRSVRLLLKKHSKKRLPSH